MRLAIALDITLYKTLQRAKGRRSETFLRFPFLGIKTIEVMFSSAGISASFRDSRHALVTSPPTMSQ